LLARIPLSKPPAGDRQPVSAARPRGRPVGLFQARLELSWCRLEKGAMRWQRRARTTATSRRATFGLPRWPLAARLTQDRGPLGQGGQAPLHADTGWTPPLPRGQDPGTPGSAPGGTDGLTWPTFSMADQATAMAAACVACSQPLLGAGQPAGRSATVWSVKSGLGEADARAPDLLAYGAQDAVLSQVSTALEPRELQSRCSSS
jgi:hypothetical protein